MKPGPNGGWITSFGHNPEIISFAHSVLTIVSRGNQWPGGHSFMYLEHRDPNPQTNLIDLWGVGPSNSEAKENVDIRNRVVQYLGPSGLVDGAGWIGCNGVDVAANHTFRCFSLDPAQRTHFLIAVAKFAGKMSTRYVYKYPGGVLGWIGSLPPISHKRGVNCADFVIKVLADAKIARLGHALIDAPSRLTKP